MARAARMAAVPEEATPASDTTSRGVLAQKQTSFESSQRVQVPLLKITSLALINDTAHWVDVAIAAAYVTGIRSAVAPPVPAAAIPSPPSADQAPTAPRQLRPTPASSSAILGGGPAEGPGVSSS